MKESSIKSKKNRTARSKLNASNPSNVITTHTFLNHKNLKEIPKLNLTTIVVLYLHNNSITTIQNLESSELSSLYLQNNNIVKVENLEGVPNIKKLYLGNNEISVLEGVSTFSDLEELHVGKQRLPMGMGLCFDPRSIHAIAKSLQVLDISGNGIESLLSLAPLRHLRSISASNNKLNDLDELCQLLKSWFYLRDAWFMGNPLSRRHRYREDIISSVYCLDSLDDKNISDATRNFIKKFENEKLKKSSRPSINLADMYPNLPHNFPPPLQKAVSVSLIQKKIDVSGTINDKSNQQVFSESEKLPPKNRAKTASTEHFSNPFSYKKTSA